MDKKRPIFFRILAWVNYARTTFQSIVDHPEEAVHQAKNWLQSYEIDWKHAWQEVRPDRDGITLETVRELGFDTVIGTYSQERVFFISPTMASGERITGAHATEKAIKDFIGYYENQIQVARDYLLNERNNRTDQWKKSSKSPESGENNT